MSKTAVLRLLDELGSEGCVATVCVSAETLAGRDCARLLPESARERARAAEILSATTRSETGLTLFLTPDRAVAIQPPLPLGVDVSAAGFEPAPVLRVFDSDAVIGLVLLRLGRYAVAALRGDELLATKTDTRYVKNRHRAGGSSQRRFERSRERLVRELYDKCCEVTRTVFGPHLAGMDYVMLGGERGTLDGFVKRCRLMQDMRPKTLSRLLSVERPNQRALRSISREVWKSRVTFF